MNIKDLLSFKVTLGYELIAKIKLICRKLLRKVMNQIILTIVINMVTNCDETFISQKIKSMET